MYYLGAIETKTKTDTWRDRENHVKSKGQRQKDK